MSKKDKYSGAIFERHVQVPDDPGETFAEMTSPETIAEMTSTEPWTDAVTREVSAWLATDPANDDACKLAEELLKLARSVRLDRPDTLVNLGYAWCQWRVMAYGFERYAGIGKKVGGDRARKQIPDEVKVKAQALIDAGMGRGKLAQALGVSEKQARRMIDEHQKK